MDTDYEAWNGERYVWPPPDDWYLASDGRWWAEGTGPGPARGGRPPAPSPTPGNGATPQPRQAPNNTPAGNGASFDAAVRTTKSRAVGEDQTQAFNTPGGQQPGATGNPLSTQNPLNTYDPTSTQNPLNTYDPTSTQNRPGPYTSSAAYGTGATTAVADRTMAAPAGYMPDAETNGGSILEAPIAPSRNNDKQSLIRRNPALVAAAGLIVVAMGIAGYLMTQSGGDGNNLQSPSDLADSTSETSLPATGDAMTDDAMNDGDTMTDDAMTDDAMNDGDTMTDDAMNDGDTMTDDSTTEGGDGQTAVSEQDAVLIDQFRTQLENLEITAAALSSGELLSFGQTACGYAQNSNTLEDYTTTRNEALAAAQNEELGSEELSLVVDAAVTVFCAEDASRIGLELPAAPAS